MMKVHLLISGRVQGVGFRAAVSRKAKNLDLTGWVRNLKDGRVEIIIEGSEENTKKFIDWVRKGSFLSKVSDVKIERQEYRGEFNNFKVVY